MSYKFSAIQIAEMAAQVEEVSEKFYKCLADGTKDDAAKEVFNVLSEDEADHKRAFLNIAKVYKEESQIYEYSIDICGMLERTLNDLKIKTFHPRVFVDPVQIKDGLDVAVRAEEGAVRVYTELRKTFIERFHKVLDTIIEVEGNHCRLVTDLRNKLSA